MTESSDVLRSLGGLTALERLSLAGSTRIIPHELSSLAKLTKLSYLDLSIYRLENEHLSYITRIGKPALYRAKTYLQFVAQSAACDGQRHTLRNPAST